MTEERGRKNMLIGNVEKSELVNRLNEMKNSDGIVVASKLLRIMLQEVRESNDTAYSEDFKFNQGIISAIKSILGYIENGNSIDKLDI